MEKLQLHYYLENNSHSMNAFVKNKAELELLRLLNHISKSLKYDLEFELEAIDEGGIKEFIKILNKKKNKNYLLALTYLGGIFTTVLTNVISDFILKNKELESLQIEVLEKEKEKLNLEIEILNNSKNEDEKIDSLNKIITYLLLDGKSKVLKSNFYSLLNEENKITAISTLELNEKNNPTSEEKIVEKVNFKKFIIKEIELEPKLISGAEIEIISPVFKKGLHNWKGNLNGEPIDFKIGDSIFRDKVQKQQISFTTGSKILCNLEVNLVLDKKGEPKIKSRFAYNIVMK